MVIIETQKWKKFGGNEIINLVEYIDEYITANPEVIVYIGTDSANISNKSKYASVICFRFPGKGVHVIFCRSTVPKVNDMMQRLMKEVEISINIAEDLSDVLKKHNKSPEIHVDLNPDPTCGSNVAHDAGIGYVKGMQYTVKSKNDAWASSSAADLIANR